jgi:hypothetical protein
MQAVRVTLNQLCGARLAAVGVAAVALLCVIAPSAGAAVPTADIVSAGPLTRVTVGNELGCQVSHAGDSRFELFPSAGSPGDCGTFLLVGDTIYAPNFAAHPSSVIGIASTPFSPVSQTGVTGSGSSGNPFRVVTVVAAGNTGVQVAETDTYVVGQESYRTDVTITNGSAAPLTGILWRAGDCYLQESDTGFGFVDPAHGAAGCALNANNSPPGRIEQWFPITGGANYQEDGYSTIWSRIGSKLPFANTCDCGTNRDNGAGISWNVSVPVGGQATFAQYTTFSPRGVAGPPPPTGTGQPSSVTQPRGSCAPRAPNICISAPGDITRFGCVRIGAFVHRFGVKLKKNSAGLLVNRVSRVSIVYFGLDRAANGADRKRPYFALVSGRGLRAGTHVLNADVRLKIPNYQVRRFPNRFRQLTYRKKLKFRFKTCPPGTG